VEGGRIDRVRPLSWSCALDVGGKPLHWLDGVTAAESLRLLGSLIDGDGGRPLRAGGRRSHEDEGEGLMAAVALHDHPDADALLERWVASGQPEERRRRAAFWMGQARGRRGYETLRRLVREDASEHFREHAVFALSQSEVPEAIDAVLEVARRDATPHVRGQALFWLGQKAGRRAVDGITRAMEEDPDTEVKRKAVFALSQLPRDEGVPLLIETARKNRNPEVRKQAMFWLGQSEDPRALAFFAEVLGR
jgi:HEAT repeat protein